MANKGFSPPHTLMGKVERLLVLISFIVVFFAIFPFFSEKVFLLTHPSYQSVDMKVLTCDVDVLVEGKHKHHETACMYEYHWNGSVYQGFSDSIHESRRTLFRKTMMRSLFSDLLNAKHTVGYINTDNPQQSFLRIESLLLSIKLIFLGFLTFLPILIFGTYGIIAFETWSDSKKLKPLLIWLAALVSVFPFMFWWIDFAFDPQTNLSMYGQKISDLFASYLKI